MIKKGVILILLICLAYPALSCECGPERIEDTKARYDQIFVGKLINIHEDVYTFILLKSWKGTTGQDTLRISLRTKDGCHRYLPSPEDAYFILLTDYGGIHNCSGSGFYDDSPMVDELDRLFSESMWTNTKYENELAHIEYDRKFVLKTSDGEIITKDKRIVLTSQKSTTEIILPMPPHSEVHRLFIIATKADLTLYPSAPDYIVYFDDPLYKPKVFSEKKKQKIIKRTMRKLKRTAS